MEKNNSGRIIIFLLIVTALAAGVYFLVSRQTAIPKAPGSLSIPGQEEETKFTVETALSIKGDIADYFRINGNIIPSKSVDIYPDTSGRLGAVRISIGSYVGKNDIVAEVDPSRPGQVFTPSPVRSTINGTVTAIYHEQGSTVAASTPIATIGDLSLLQIEAEISEQDISKVKKGSAAELSFAAFPGRKYSASVIELSPVVDRLTRTMKIKLEFTRSYPEIKAGMFASIKLFTAVKRNAVLVPAEAVVERDMQKYVFSVDSSMTVKMLSVETGISKEGKTEIISGLEEGLEVVIKGQTLLDDNVRVIIPSRERG